MVVDRYDMRIAQSQPVLAGYWTWTPFSRLFPRHSRWSPCLPTRLFWRTWLWWWMLPSLQEGSRSFFWRPESRFSRSIPLFDVYAGQKIGPGVRSLAYHLTFQAQDRTLKDKDVVKLRRKILRRLEHELGAKLGNSYLLFSAASLIQLNAATAAGRPMVPAARATTCSSSSIPISLASALRTLEDTAPWRRAPRRCPA